MNDPGASIQALAEEVRYLRARQEILDCVCRYARGVDRHDEELILSAYHRDAVDQHGSLARPMPEFAASVNEGHARWTRLHTHNITTHSCQIDGDTAHAESYVLAGLASKDGSHVRLTGARYVDRLERREGHWRIVVRRVVIDWRISAPTVSPDDDGRERPRFPEGTWDRSDISYDRPLQLGPDEVGAEIGEK